MNVKIVRKNQDSGNTSEQMREGDFVSWNFNENEGLWVLVVESPTNCFTIDFKPCEQAEIYVINDRGKTIDRYFPYGLKERRFRKGSRVKYGNIYKCIIADGDIAVFAMETAGNSLDYGDVIVLPQQKGNSELEYELIEK